MSEAGENSPALLQVHDVSKRFPGVRALHRVNLSLQRGEVLAVVGENGAGKSTLMKILAGVYQPDAGQILIDGRPVDIDSVHTALELGVSLIHQELNLSDNLDAAANIFLGREPHRFGWIDLNHTRRESESVMSLVGLDCPPETIVRELSIGRQQMVEIAKALSARSRVLIMDEPTSSLTERETESLFRVVRDLRRQGVSIIYISHRLSEVCELADRVVVLRDGENAGELRGAEISHDNMVPLMVGRDVSQFYHRQSRQPGDVVLEVDGLVVPANPRHRLDFTVRAGEIVGVAGLVGAGRTEMMRTLFGVDAALHGEIRVDGRPLRLRSPLDAMRAGIMLAPEDRRALGLLVEMTVRENISLPGLRDRCRAGIFIDFAREIAEADAMIDRLDIRTPSREQVVEYLSGGNQQKVVLAKWLSLSPRVLLLDEPTRGIDVGSKEEIYALMESLAREGVAILFASSELEEILGMSDRALVMHEGRLAGELATADLTEEAVMQLATGSQRHPNPVRR